MSVILYKNLDTSKIVLEENKNSKSAVQSFRVFYKNEDGSRGPLCIQGPEMNAPFGISNNISFLQQKNPKYQKDDIKWYLQLSFKDEDINEKIRIFKTKMKEVDSTIKQQFMDKYMDKYYPLEKYDLDPNMDEEEKQKQITMMKNMHMKILYKSPIKEGKNGYADTFRISISWDNNVNSPKQGIGFYRVENKTVKEYTYQDVVNYSKVIPLFTMNNCIYTNIPMLTPSTKLVQLQFTPPDNLNFNLKGFQIKSEEPDSDASSVEGQYTDSDVENNTDRVPDQDQEPQADMNSELSE